MWRISLAMTRLTGNSPFVVTGQGDKAGGRLEAEKG